MGDAVERHRQYAEYLESLDIIVYTKRSEKLSEHKISDKVFGYPTNSSSRIGFIFDALKIAARIHESRPFDIVVCQDPYAPAFVGYLLKMKFRCKLQINFHGDYWGSEFYTGYRKILQPFSKFLVSQADGVRVVSSGIRAKLVKAGIAESKIVLLPTPVNFKDFGRVDSIEVEKLRNKFSNKKIVLFAGRLVAEKNLPGLLTAFAQVIKKVPASQLVIAGAGPLDADLKQVTSKLGLEKAITFTGALSPQMLSTYVHACDILVLPSFTESFGKVLIEAALAKKPVVATATTGALEIVDDGKSGFLVPIGNERALVEKITELLQHPKLSEQMGEYGEKLVREKFNREKIVQGIIEFWKKLTMSSRT